MKKPLLLALGLATIGACGGKVVVDAETASNTGGAGGTISSVSTADGAPNTTTDSSVIAVSVGPSSVAATTGSGSSCDPNYTCAEAITPPDGDSNKLCDGTLAFKQYLALFDCTCAGACATECGNSVCLGANAGTNCKSCLSDTANGCGLEFIDCANGG